MPDGGPLSTILPERWTRLRKHAIQSAYWNSPHRFNTVPAGRRSGKTELAKRKLIKKAIRSTAPWSPRFFAGCPTRDQAKRIYWDDLKLLSPPNDIAEIRESDLCIRYINDAELWVLGLDVPARIEGSPWDGGVLDEYGNMKPEAWGANVRPALSDRLGWCDLIGVPEGRNHYYELDRFARAMQAELGDRSEWGSFTWFSADILPASEIEAARRDLDELTFKQEYEGSFISFEGRCYYPFEERLHCARLKYDPKQKLILMFDFNVEPGVCAIGQEQQLPSGHLGTGIIGEVHIPRNSNTPAVCRKLIADWGTHKGMVECYGDYTGGNGGTAKVMGSDWDLIKEHLRPVFGDRLTFIVPVNPRERERVNSLNSRLKSMHGDIRLMVDPAKAPNTVRDFEGVVLLKGGSGEIDKKATPLLTHLTDGIGYYVNSRFPIRSNEMMRIGLGGV